MDPRPVRRLVLALAAVAVLAGCDAVPPRLAADYADRQAHSTTLENKSDVPITYITDDPGERTLAPGAKVTNAGGSFQVPPGFVCTWRQADSSSGDGFAVPGISHGHYNWVTFGGQVEITSCTPQ
jgi:hypothetical protein